MKASVILLVAFAATALMRKRSAAARHWILSGAILCAAATPLLEHVVPPWRVEWSHSAAQPSRNAPQEREVARARPLEPAAAAATEDAARLRGVSRSDAPASLDLSSIAIAIWTAGAALSLFIVIAGVCRLRWLEVRARRVTDGPWVELAREIASRYGVARPVAILASDRPAPIVTWGLLRPRVLIPRAALGWTADRIHVVLGHELAHVQRADWSMQLAAELLKAIYWFNPLLWIAGTRLRQESEHACDDAVLNLGVDGADYAGHLLELARDASRHYSRWSLRLPAPAIVRPSTFERRVTAMLNVRVNRTPPSRTARLLAGVALAAVTIPLAGFGQTGFTTVSGVVTDPEGRMIPNVAMALRSTQRDAKYEVKTNRLGQFEFVGVPDGDYVLDASYMGFRDLHDPLSVAGQPIQRNLSLEVGMLQETLTIVGGGPAAPVSGPARRSDGPQWRPAAEYDPCSASPVGGCLKPPMKIRDVKPEYPPHLSVAKASGVVVLSAKIGTDGSIVNVQLADPADTIDPAFVQAAVAAVNQWGFTPTHLGGVPIPVEMRVTVNFVAR